MKKRSIGSREEAEALEMAVVQSAGKALQQVRELQDARDILGTLWAMKFLPVGCDPLDADRPINIVEQINQTFTYIASARAVRMLFELHPELAPFTLNLGNVSGTDIESNRGSGLACEVFAAVNTSNNRKLAKDIEKVGKTEAGHRYVFFMCPGHAAGRHQNLERVPGVQVWSVSSDV